MSASGLKRTSSPVARAPGVRETPVRAVPIKAVAASDVRDFPAAALSAGEQANPKHGFVSRSGGAFKFRALAPPPSDSVLARAAESVWIPTDHNTTRL